MIKCSMCKLKMKDCKCNRSVEIEAPVVEIEVEDVTIEITESDVVVETPEDKAEQIETKKPIAPVVQTIRKSDKKSDKKNKK